ncbi:uncharacterized protein LOC117172336 isoform X2 [Belonocnema kinseyi]|uniref:uncharacterized protein LOC117172336 isoform X2 n=1 Tax=Belonocnema kinseyi TaxID=2817044 RepID=UPI00143D3179|nr:uncharacterized protein LOC117172336 isoform X2 [Belonocnema kinseyi]
MPPPYDTDETNAILHKLVECELDAPDHWPEYTIKLVGDGQTYYEAVNMLKKLNTQEYMYSSGSEIHSKDKAAAVAKEIRARKSLPNLKSILAVPTLKKNFEPCKKILQTSTEGNSVDPLFLNEEFDTDSASLLEVTKKPELAKSRDKEEQLSIAGSIDDYKRKRQSSTGESSTDFDSIHNSFEVNDNKIQSKMKEKGGIKGFPAKNRPKMKLVAENKSSDNADKKYLLIREIRGLRAEIRELQANQVSLMNMFEAVSCTNYVPKKSFAEEYSLTLPFNTLQEFADFDNRLATDEKCCKEFKGSLALSFDKKIMHKTVNKIFKKYFSKNVSSQFTAVKRVATKLVFKEYHMCKCIIEKYKCSEEEVISDISTVLSNVKDWDGGRKLRLSATLASN